MDAQPEREEPEVDRLNARLEALGRCLTLREQELDALFEAAPGVMYRCRLNADWTMDRMSTASLRLLGYPSSDFIGNAVRCFASVIHPGDRLRVTREIRGAVCKGERYDVEYRVIHADGTVRWLRDTGALLRQVSSESEVLIGALTDITPQVEAEDALLRTEALFRSLFTLSPVGMCLNDLETGTFLDVNDALARTTGYLTDELLGMQYFHLSAPEYAEQDREQLEIMRRHRRFGPYHKQCVRKDGSRFPAVITGLLMRDKSGRRLVWSIIDDRSPG